MQQHYKSTKLTVTVFGLYPFPPGQRLLYSSDSGAGQSSQRGPQALPTEQQQVARVTGWPRALSQRRRPPGPSSTSRKHCACRLSTHAVPALISSWSGGQWHSKAPSVLTHVPYKHDCGDAHSSTSVQLPPLLST